MFWNRILRRNLDINGNLSGRAKVFFFPPFLSSPLKKLRGLHCIFLLITAKFITTTSISGTTVVSMNACILACVSYVGRE